MYTLLVLTNILSENKIAGLFQGTRSFLYTHISQIKNHFHQKSFIFHTSSCKCVIVIYKYEYKVHFFLMQTTPFFWLTSCFKVLDGTKCSTRERINF